MTDTPDTRQHADDTNTSADGGGSGPTIKRRRRIISDTASSTPENTASTSSKPADNASADTGPAATGSTAAAPGTDASASVTTTRRRVRTGAAPAAEASAPSTDSAPSTAPETAATDTPAPSGTAQSAAAASSDAAPAAERPKVKRTRRVVSDASNDAEGAQKSDGDGSSSRRKSRAQSAGEQSSTDAPETGTAEKNDADRSGGQPKRTRNRSKKNTGDAVPDGDAATAAPSTADVAAAEAAAAPRVVMPPSAPAKPRIGDSRPAPAAATTDGAAEGESVGPKRRRRRGGRGRGKGGGQQNGQQQSGQQQNGQQSGDGAKNGQQQGKGRGGRRKGEPVSPVEATLVDDRPVELDEGNLKKRRGAERKGRPIGRYQMVAHVKGDVTHIAVLEGRALIEHYVSRPADDVSQIHGNIYLGRVQNVLPGMEAAFVDIGTPKNAVLYRGDVTFDRDDLDQGDGAAPAKGRSGKGRRNDGPRIEELLKARQTIICQVTKNPIGHKGARLTTEVSLPGRFVVLVPNSTTYGISKRLPDKERKRLRRILDRVKPEGHGVIVRTAAEDVTAEEIERDVGRLHQQWQEIEKLATTAKTPSLLFREPDMAVRVIREEFNKDYRGVIIDDRALFEQVKGYMETVTPALADRIEYHDPTSESLSVFERFHVAEQFRKAIDRKVWLPSGGSLIIEHTEALTVIDVNTGKNVGSTNLEETVFSNNLEAAEEIAKQLRLRDIGGIIVIDFIDMEVKSNRDEVMKVFREALARDKTRTQAFDITELGLVEMTRKRIGEGLLESVTCGCDKCEGRGVTMLPECMPD